LFRKTSRHITGSEAAMRVRVAEATGGVAHHLAIVALLFQIPVAVPTMV
jgi:hypothetical protein